VPVATDARRKDIEHIVRKAAPQWLARTAVALASFVAIAVPALMSAVAKVKARANNPNGSSADITWVHWEAADADQYRVVAAVSASYVSVYDPVAWVLIWINLAISLAATGIIMFVSLRPKMARESQQPRRSCSTGLPEEAAPES
jgi:hypothetical protein